MVAAFDYCLHGKGRRRAVDRHGDARPGRRAARRPPAPRLGHRAGHRGRRRGADPGVLRRPGGLGAVAPARLPARAWTSPRSQRANPQAIGVHPRRARHHRLGRDQRGVRGATRWRSSAPRSDFLAERGAAGAVRPGAARLRAAAGRPSAGPGPPRSPRCIRGLASTDRPQVGHFTDADVVLDFLARGRAPAAGRARHLLPRPLPAHQGAPAGARPAADGAARRGDRPAARAARRLPRGLRAPTTSGTPTRTRRRCAAPTRRSCWCPASACSASARTSRPPGSPASSTSTPST